MDDARIRYRNGVKANGALTCPQCGAPITDERCEYCGVIFYDFACVECDHPFYLKIKYKDQIRIYKVLMDDATITTTMDNAPVFYADNMEYSRIVAPENIDIDLHFHMVY